MSMLTRIADGYQNLISRLGTGADRATQGAYFVPVLSQQQIEAAYRSSWLTRKVHDLPPFEMTRAGRNWQAEQEQIEKLEALEGGLDLWAKLRDALTTARLHGGAAIILGVVGAGSPEQPLEPSRVRLNALRYAVVVSRHQLTAPQGFETDTESEWFGGPAMWELKGARGNSVRLHPSRVVTFHGSPVPSGASTVSQLDQFWGDPLLFTLKSAIDNAEGTQASVATLLHELKQDVIKIPGLTDLLATSESETRLANRIGALNTLRSMFNAVLLDGGDDEGKGGEEWETRQLNLSQMPEIVEQFVGLVAGATDIPKTRLMGASPGGMQSTGKGEQDDFNRMIAARQSAELARPLRSIDAVLIPAALGSRPPEVYYVFAPLEEADRKEAAEIEKMEMESAQAVTNMAHLPRDVIAKALYSRMVESGRWPGLEAAMDESPDELGAEPERDETEPPEPANENAVQEMERRGQVTTDQALSLLADAAPRPLYVQRKLLNGAEFIAWAKGQGFETTLDADDLHVTVAYSRAPVDWITAGGEDWSGNERGEILVKPGGPRIVDRSGADGEAVVLLFASSELSWRHEQIKRAGASWDWPEYQPHVTITLDAPAGLELSKVEPFRGALRFGPEIFEDIKEG